MTNLFGSNVDMWPSGALDLAAAMLGAVIAAAFVACCCCCCCWCP